MKKIGNLLLMLLIILTLTACGKENKKEEKNTPAYLLAADFKEEIKKEKDLVKVAEKISSNEVLQTKMMVEEKTNEDFLAGFDDKVTNFKKAVAIQPVISTLPFVAYVFESENISELKNEIESKANMQWNICTSADEKVLETDGNYVFFVMSPKSFEE